MFLSLKRIIKTGFVNFWRNGFVSTSSVVVMSITLFVMGSLIFINQILDSSLELLKDKVDINAYFTIDAPEESILKVKEMLELREDVEVVIYTSREEAEARFRERHKDDEIEIQALDELGTNPLLASLSIKAEDPSYYESINNFLQSDPSTVSTEGVPIVAKVNFHQNKAAIEKLEQWIKGIETFGLVTTLVLVAVSIIIVFNTIRMAIYISREEIAVMRLVGASDMYIRGPFVFSGIMSGMIASIITLVSFYPLVLWLRPGIQEFFGDFNIFLYYTQNFGKIFTIIMLTGVFLGAFSSFLAVKKYLRV
jgi:cell division transport system permease protein